MWLHISEKCLYTRVSVKFIPEHVQGIWWWTGKPGMLQSMGSQRVRHDWVTELNWACANDLEVILITSLLVSLPQFAILCFYISPNFLISLILWPHLKCQRSTHQPIQFLLQLFNTSNLKCVMSLLRGIISWVPTVLAVIFLLGFCAVLLNIPFICRCKRYPGVVEMRRVCIWINYGSTSGCCLVTN